MSPIQLLPSVIYFLAAAGLAMYLRLRGGKGIPWLIGTAVSIAAAVMLVWLRGRLPLSIIAMDWMPFTTFSDAPMLALDGQSWPYSFALSVVLAGIYLTASARMSAMESAWPWVGTLVTGGISLLAIQASNFMTIVLTWTALDLFDAVLVSTRYSGAANRRQVVIGFGARVISSLLVIFAALINRSLGIAPAFGPLPPLPAIMLMLAAGLRLGVLPLNLPVVPDQRYSRGLGTALRMANVAASLVVLARIPAIEYLPAQRNLLMALTALGSLFGAAMWLGAQDEMEGRPYWIIALSGMAVFTSIQGRSIAGIAWGCVLMLSGSLLFLHSARARGVILLPLAGLLALSALPFTPAAQGWLGIFAPPFSFWHFLFLLTHLLLMLGYLRHMLRPGDALRNLEPWVHTAYPIGLGMTAAGLWYAGAQGWPGSFSPGLWWASLVTGAGLALTGSLYAWLMSRKSTVPALFLFYGRALSGVGRILSRLFSLGWLYRLLAQFFEHGSHATRMVIAVLEGDAGILWVLVMLAAFISALRGWLG